MISRTNMAVVAACVLLGATVSAMAQTNGVPLRSGGVLVANYATDGVPMKPYVKELFSPSGVQVTVDSPPDHFHHHGLMFAIAAGGVDFWSEKPFEKFGKQIPVAGSTRAEASSVDQKLAWTTPAGATVLTETRKIQADAAQGGPNVVTWTTVLRAEGGQPVRLSGSHYFGLGMRFPADMAEKAVFLLSSGTSSGQVVRSDETLRAAPWCAATGTIGGKPVTVAMWDAPNNERRAVWFTMTKPFSYLSATLDLQKHPMDLKPGGSLSLNYGIAVFDGVVDAAAIEKARTGWLAKMGMHDEKETVK